MFSKNDRRKRGGIGPIVLLVPESGLVGPLKAGR